MSTLSITLSEMVVSRGVPNWITDEEQERIRKFAATPRHRRGPHFLEPESEEDADDQEEEPARR